LTLSSPISYQHKTLNESSRRNATHLREFTYPPLLPLTRLGLRGLEFLFNRKVLIEISSLDSRLLSPFEYSRCEL
jgi:hypothetical protein